MGDKTLGQICFEAFMKLKPGDTYEWSDQVKDSWQAAAEAVVAVTTAPNIVSGTVDTKTGNLRIHSPAELTARDKVIEAAKAFTLQQHGGTLHDAHLALTYLREAVQELLAAEGEE